MGSTGGGFCMGFGVCVIMVCFVSFFVLMPYYAQIMRWKENVESIYDFTRSSMYEKSMNALKIVSPHTETIAKVVALMPGLGNVAKFLMLIPLAHSSMEKVYESSELAYKAITIIEIVPEYLLYGMIFGAILVLIGIILVERARRLSTPRVL